MVSSGVQLELRILSEPLALVANVRAGGNSRLHLHTTCRWLSHVRPMTEKRLGSFARTPLPFTADILLSANTFVIHVGRINE